MWPTYRSLLTHANTRCPIKPKLHILPRRLSPIVLLVITSVASAQDIHFSQVDVDPMLFNPAYSGFFDGRGRLGLVYRNQWASVSDPFSTFAATAELAMLPGRYRRNGLNIGTFLYRDKAGTLAYGTTAANAVLSYYQALNYRNTSLVSIAIEGGLGQQGYNPSDASLADEAEHLDSKAVLYPTLGMGVAWFYQATETLSFRAGVSGRNLNRPNISHLGLGDVVLNRKWNGYVRIECGVTPTIELQPLVALQLQKNYSELLYGLNIKWHYDRSTYHTIAYSAGITMRHGDAIIADVAAEYDNFLLSLSYDANISPLVAASRSIGAIEIALVYHIAKPQNKAKTIPCATF